jgi:hypothetical protein
MSLSLARPPAGARGRVGAFLGEAIRSTMKAEMLLPALLMLVLLTGTNIVILQNLPAEGAPPAKPFIAAAALRAIGLMVISVAVLRVAGGSDRPPWRLDGAFWLYQLVAPIGFVVAALVALLIGADTPLGLLFGALATGLLLAPIAVWLAAIAIHRPLAWNPANWVRAFGRWLAPYLVWTVLLVVPMSALHAAIDRALLEGVSEGLFWPLALFDGALSTVMALAGLALAAMAYRQVARG